MFGIADLRSVNFIDAQIVPFLAFLIWLLIPFNVTLLIFIGLLLPIYEDVAGHLICFCPRSEVSHFFKEEWLHWVFIASVVVSTFQWTELGNICSVFKIKCIMIMLILLVQIQDSQVFINYHKLQAMSFYIYHRAIVLKTTTSNIIIKNS